MYLLVGLGNPGPKYQKNRHNIGFMAVDEIVRRHSFSDWRVRFQGQVSEGRLGAEKILALKPATYMNESGRAVGEAMRYYKLTPSDVTVVYDELDLALGKLRVKLGGGNSGHNGLRSIDAHIGKDYWKVRVGIGHPGDRDRVTGHVLGDFSKADMPEVEKMVEAIASAAPDLYGADAPTFMSKVSLVLKPPVHRPKNEMAMKDAIPAIGPVADPAMVQAFAKARANSEDKE